MKKTPISQLKGVVKQLKGNTEPHIWHEGVRHALSKSDAREMSTRFARKTLKEKFGVDLREVARPERRGEFSIEEPPYQLSTQVFNVRFYDGESLLIFGVEVFPNESGFSHEIIFNVIEDYLADGYEALDEYKLLSSKVMSPQEVENEAREVALDRAAENALMSGFPQWFQRKYKKNVSWSSSGGRGVSIWTLICPTDEGERKYTGTATSKRAAKLKALVAAGIELNFTFENPSS